MSARFSLRRNNQTSAPPDADQERAEAYAAAGYDRAPSLEFDHGGNVVGDPGEPTVHEPGTVYDPAGVYQPAAVYEPVVYGPAEEDESWLAPDTRRRVKMAVPTFVLLALVVIAGAFWGGAEVDKHFGNHSTTSAAGLAAALGGRGAATGGAGTGREGFAGLGVSGGGGFAGGGFAASAPAASGTVSAISGDDLTVASTSGGKVKVVLTSSTIVTRTGEGSSGPLKVGDTVRVQGTKAPDGTITATSVTATAAGVSLGRGGGFAGLGAGAGAATGAGGSRSVGSGSGGSTTQTTVLGGGFSGDGNGVSGG